MSDSTDQKIRVLQQSLPDCDERVLLELLLACDGDVAKVAQLVGGTDSHSPRPKAKSRAAAKVVKQQKLFTKPVKRDTHVPPELSLAAAVPTSNTAKVSRQVTLRGFVAASESSPGKALRAEIPGKTRHLYDPADVAELLPCTMHPNIFPAELATRLLKSLLEESRDWAPNRFHMFDRECASPHKTAFYTSDAAAYAQKKHSYNGQVMALEPRMFNEEMREARAIVEAVVNREIERRGFVPLQARGRWTSEMAICNRYDGARSAVGYHSDQMTHLGPQCVIASVSLGVTREFRLKRRRYPTAAAAASKKGLLAPAIAVHVPHNSLIIMHAGCQELYKHSIVPQSTLDMHPVSGNVRINITYRDYLAAYAPDKIPQCDCKRPMILRTVRDPSAGADDDGKYRYAWYCGSSYRGETK